MARFAEGTTVSPEKSQQEIGACLRRYGATSFATAWEPGRAMVAFGAHDRHVRMVLEIPDVDDDEFATTPTGRARDRAGVGAAHEAEIRRRWRALTLAIKAKLEAVETGITLFEDEFLAHIVLPDGQTVAEHVRPAVAEAYRTGVIAPFIPPPALTAGP
jgi:hypothetical protein